MKNNIDDKSDWYETEQLDFDKTLISYRYATIKSFFVGKTCLEMGPADGIMTRFLTNDFEFLDLVEGSKRLLDLIPNYHNIRKYNSLFEVFDPDKHYNTIIMEHILEHIEFPKLILKKVKKWLDVKGVLIVGVPNAKSIHRLAAVKMGLLSSEYNLNERDYRLGHYRVYDLIELEKELKSVGFKIIHKGGVFFKPLSNKQIQDNWTREMKDAFFELGKDFQNNAAEIFIVVTQS